MLRSSPLVAFTATTNADRSKAFYGGVLGLRLVTEDNFALVYDAHGTTLRVSMVEQVVVAPYAVLGWEVNDIAGVVRELTTVGVTFERYPWMEQDELGIWTAPSGTRVGWFKDPDDNLLS